MVNRYYLISEDALKIRSEFWTYLFLTRTTIFTIELGTVWYNERSRIA
jgi:hypothetical protein